MKIEVLHNGKVVQTKDFNEGSYKVGRAPDCDLVLESTKVSKHHALLVVKGNRAAILDTNSSNGTFVNGILIKKQLLRSDDQIEIGDFVLRKFSEAKQKKSLEVFATQGSMAVDAQLDPNLDAQLGEVPEPISETNENPKQNAALSVVEWVDKKLLIPFYEIVKITDYRFLTAVILVVTMSAAAFFSVTPILSWGNSITKQESLKRGHTILKQIVRENYRILNKSTDTSLLTVSAGESDKDMLEVYIFDTKTKTILAPLKHLGESRNDPYLALGLEDVIDKGMTETEKDRGDGIYVLIHSIPYYGNPELNSSTESGEGEASTPSALVVGYFKIPRNIVGIYEPLAISGLIAVVLGLTAFFFLFKMTSYPVVVLNEQLDAALKGDDLQISCVAKFPELESLTNNLNFAVSRMKSAGGGLASQPNGIPGGVDTDSEEKQYLKCVEEFCLGSTDGILVLDRDKKIKLVGPVLADLLSLRPQYAIGQNISEACRDGSFAGTVIDMCERVFSSLGENQTATLEINGTSRNMMAVGHRTSTGELQWVVITVKMNG